MAITLQAKTVEGRSPTCRYERFGLVSTRDVLVPFPDSLRRQRLRECLTMKLRALRRPEVWLHVPTRTNDNKRVRFARVSFWTRHRILKQVSSPCTAMVPRRGDSKRRHSVLLHEEGRQFETNE
jgi:hypothetical protein